MNYAFFIVNNMLDFFCVNSAIIFYGNFVAVYFIDFSLQFFHTQSFSVGIKKNGKYYLLQYVVNITEGSNSKYDLGSYHTVIHKPRGNFFLNSKPLTQPRLLKMVTQWLRGLSMTPLLNSGSCSKCNQSVSVHVNFASNISKVTKMYVIKTFCESLLI